jgi:peptide/nickel transport system substrate-binding protein
LTEPGARIASRLNFAVSAVNGSFQGLTRVDRDGKVQPQLARSWTVSPDGLTYTFALQQRQDQGLRVRRLDVGDDRVERLLRIDRARRPDRVDPQKALYAVIADVKAPDPQTLVLTLSKPSGNLLFWRRAASQ